MTGCIWPTFHCRHRPRHSCRLRRRSHVAGEGESLQEAEAYSIKFGCEGEGYYSIHRLSNYIFPKPCHPFELIRPFILNGQPNARAISQPFWGWRRYPRAPRIPLKTVRTALAIGRWYGRVRDEKCLPRDAIGRINAPCAREGWFSPSIVFHPFYTYCFVFLLYAFRREHKVYNRARTSW